MSKIRFGPTGIGPVGDAVANLEMYAELGFRAAEVLFTYGVYIKKKEDAVRIGEAARRLGIFLSVHAPYWVNLNSKDEAKVENSKKRILKCCEVASWLEAKRVVFHPGFYGKVGKEKDFEKIKEGIIEMMRVVEENDWDVELCVELMGKVNVFGSIDEVGRLVKESGCGVCIDFAHVLARYGRYEFSEIEKNFRMKSWHVHFSGIEFGEKGERKHLATPVEEWRKVLGFLKKLGTPSGHENLRTGTPSGHENLQAGKDVVLICESPDAVEDSLVGKRIFESLS